MYLILKDLADIVRLFIEIRNLIIYEHWLIAVSDDLQKHGKIAGYFFLLLRSYSDDNQPLVIATLIPATPTTVTIIAALSIILNFYYKHTIRRSGL